jgi:Putative prokaryotic signal transducing protein
LLQNRSVGKLVLVHSAANATEGHLLRGRLEAEGIPVLTKGEGDGPYRMGPLYLWVPEEHEIQARLVLAEVTGGGLAIDEDEPVGTIEDEADPTDQQLP